MVFDIFVVGRWLHQASKFHNDEIGKLGEIYLNIIKKKREEKRHGERGLRVVMREKVE